MFKKSSLRFLFVQIKREHINDIQSQNKNESIAYLSNVEPSLNHVTGKELMSP